MKKKIFVGIFVGMISFGGIAQAGEYDGIWRMPDMPILHFMIYNTNSTLVVTELDSTFLTCDVLVGQMNGNVGTVQHLINNDDSNIQATIIFITPTTATFVATGCSGNCTNTPPVGVEFPFLKLL